tara:strand:+ start:81 stop:260 length:180 start_codon:yes stop_codon:yes gene_type:complete
MKVGDLVQWYSRVHERTTVDFGLVRQVLADQVFIVWQSGDGNGWFSQGHPSIGVVNESW